VFNSKLPLHDKMLFCNCAPEIYLCFKLITADPAAVLSMRLKSRLLMGSTNRQLQWRPICRN